MQLPPGREAGDLNLSKEQLLHITANNHLQAAEKILEASRRRGHDVPLSIFWIKPAVEHNMGYKFTGAFKTHFPGNVLDVAVNSIFRYMHGLRNFCA